LHGKDNIKIIVIFWLASKGDLIIAMFHENRNEN